MLLACPSFDHGGRLSTRSFLMRPPARPLWTGRLALCATPRQSHPYRCTTLLSATENVLNHHGGEHLIITHTCIILVLYIIIYHLSQIYFLARHYPYNKHHSNNNILPTNTRTFHIYKLPQCLPTVMILPHLSPRLP